MHIRLLFLQAYAVNWECSDFLLRYCSTLHELCCSSMEADEAAPLLMGCAPQGLLRSLCRRVASTVPLLAPLVRRRLSDLAGGGP